MAVLVWLIACQASVPPSAAPPTGSAPPLQTPTVTSSPAVSPSPVGSTAVTPYPSEAPPSTQDLIAAALTAGRIDYPTSLLYRVQAQFAPSLLPAELQGVASIEEDRGAFTAVRQLGEALPADIRAKLEPYLLRPTDPGSIFASAIAQPAPSGDTSKIELAASHRSGIGETAIELIPCYQEPSPAPGREAGNWADLPSFKYHFKVWGQCPSGALDADQALIDDLASTVQLFEGIWKQETAYMDIAPLPDAFTDNRSVGNDDDWIDIYLLYPIETITRDGTQVTVSATRAAEESWTPEAGSPAGNGKSGFIYVDRCNVRSTAACDQAQSAKRPPSCASTAAPPLRQVVVHEFFHLLQDARNGTAIVLNGVNHWFTEASAQWAQTFFLPYEQNAQVHSRWFPCFVRDIEKPLLTPIRNLDYEKYIWPFFMQQETNNDKVIAQAWAAIAGANTWDEINNAIDTQLPFKDHFRDFAVRNFNADEDPGDKNAPVKPLYAVKSDDGFPTTAPESRNVGKNPDPAKYQLRSLDTPLEFDDSIASLSAHYYHFEIPPDADTLVGQVIFDFSQFGPHDALDVDAIVAIKDTSKPAGVRWERRRESTPPDQLKFCRNDPKNDVMSIDLVLSNHDKDPTVEVGNSFKVFSPSQPCAAGQITFHQVTTETPAQSGGWSSTEDDMLTIQLNLVFKDGKVVNDGGSWTFIGRRDGSNPVQGGGCPCTVHDTDSGSGTWVENEEPREGIGQIAFYVDNGVPTLFGWVVPHYHEVSTDSDGTHTYDHPFDVPWLFTIKGQPIDPNGGPYDMSSTLDYENISHEMVHADSSGTIVAPAGPS